MRLLPAAALLVWSPAFADTNADVTLPRPATVPTARPVVPIDDTRSYGPTARNWIDVSVTPWLLFADDSTTFQLTSQISIGFPRINRREIRDLYGSYSLTDY